ncbi:MAG: hypothetical protein AAB088_00750, partial [Actinomycetota bacterium]
MPAGMSRLHPGHTYALSASYGCTRRICISPNVPSHIFMLRNALAAERPHHENHNRDQGACHNHVVAGALHPFAVWIESHVASIVGLMETVEVLRTDGVVTVTMNRPSKKNAANGTMWQELLDTFRHIA